MNTSFSFQPLSSAKVNTESGSRPVGPSQPLALVLNRLEYSLTFAYRVKSKLLIGPIFGGAYISSWLGVFYSILILIGLFYYMFSEKTGFYVLYSILFFYLTDFIYSIVFYDFFLIDIYVYALFQLLTIFIILKSRFSDWKRLYHDKALIWLTLIVLITSILFHEGLSLWFN